MGSNMTSHFLNIRVLKIWTVFHRLHL